MQIQPDLPTLKGLYEQNNALDEGINMYPVYAFLPALDLTPHVAYLKLAQLNNKDRTESFLLESAKTTDELDR